MNRKTTTALLSLVLLTSIASCTTPESEVQTMPPPSDIDYGLDSSVEVLLTSERGDKIANADNVSFATGKASGTSIVIHPDIVKQTIVGIGSSFTESSAFVLAHLDRERRREVMNSIYGEDGANFSLARTTIASTDFSTRACSRESSYDFES